MSETAQIKFGTSGWRAIIGDEFTFSNVRLVTRAIAGYLKQQSAKSSVIIGHDTRFLSKEFAKFCADVLAENGVNVLLSNRDVPTPVISYQIISKKQEGGINFSASHNPPEYNGIKFSPAYGGPAPKEVTSAIEKNIFLLQKKHSVPEKNKTAGTVKIFDPRADYIKRMKSIIDLSCIRKAGLKIAVDCMYGTSRGYLDSMLQGCCRELVVFNDYLNPLFGGFPPEPDKPYIKKMIFHVRGKRFDLGLACDGDADRFGIVDSGGVFFTPNEVFTMLFYYMLKTRGKTNVVARTLATTHMIDAIARKEGVKVIETPVGFKYIGEILSKNDCLIGGEESGGLSIKGHVPEKDGVLACLLIAEMVAREKKTLKQILSLVHKKYGYLCSGRINMHLKEKDKEILLQRFKKLSSRHSFAGMQIRECNLTDGYKFIFDNGSWMLFRVSGTEPVVRCYFEADSQVKLKYIKNAITEFTRV